jgi:hypothetical protein
MATTNVPTDMTQFFDFGEAAMPDMTVEGPRDASVARKHRVGCPVREHPIGSDG